MTDPKSTRPRTARRTVTAREVGRGWGSLRRGELYRVRDPADDPKRARVFVVVSRSSLLATRFPAVICAPIHSQRSGLATQVDVGTAEGLKHASAIMCDTLATIPRSRLTDYLGALGPAKLAELKIALRIALDIE